MRIKSFMFKYEKCGENDTQIAINHMLLMDARLRLYKPIRMEYWYPRYAYTCFDLESAQTHLKCLAHFLHSADSVSKTFYVEKAFSLYV